ncbi:MAG: hypothetical protein JWM38_2054, partial [Sphingomonas bacterium]|nr:hypothetical protein [Sphingomonas bacterium]
PAPPAAVPPEGAADGSSQAVPATQPAAANYNPCSRTVTDSCVQLNERSTRGRRARR